MKDWPKRRFYEVLRLSATEEAEKAQLQHIFSREGKSEYNACMEESYTFVEIQTSVLLGRGASYNIFSTQVAKSAFVATADQGLRCKKIIQLKRTCDDAMARSPFIKACFE